MFLKVKVILLSLFRVTEILSPSTFSGIFSEATEPIEAIFYMAPSSVRGTKNSSCGLGTMTKIATIHILWLQNPLSIT